MISAKTPQLKQLLNNCRQAFVMTVAFSFLVNLLMLTVPLYMLQIFDRVLASRSYDTLIYLSVIAIVALLVLGLLDVARSRILVRVSRWLDNKLSPLALSRSIDELLSGGHYAPESLRDIAAIRQFLSGSSVFSLFDIPWTPLYLLVVYALHPLLGVIATVGAMVLFGFALLNEIITREPLKLANTQHTQNQQSINKALDNAEVIQAMGMLPNIVNKWFGANESVLTLQGTASDRAAMLLSLSKFFRMTLQITLLGVGALLVIQNQLTPGIMIAASIISARALAPIEQTIATWKMWKHAKAAYGRLKDYLELPNPRNVSLSLPKPKGHVIIENVTYLPPRSKKPILLNLNFEIKPGETMALIGPSGSGKSTLARLMLGIWQTSHGIVRLDGADVYNWERSSFGREVGYLPQDVDLFHSSISENIARMGNSNDEDIIAAAKLAGAHELILQLPDGYAHHAGGFHLSGGQRQRIALARAFYGDPQLIVLDEPNASLDNDGDLALDHAVQTARERGITMILISHRTNLVKHADRIAVLAQGQLNMIGPRDEILKKLQVHDAPMKQASGDNNG